MASPPPMSSTSSGEKKEEKSRGTPSPTKGSVFDRLSHAETSASAIKRKEKETVQRKHHSSTTPSPTASRAEKRSPHTKGTPVPSNRKPGESIFERLSHAETVASTLRKSPSPTKTSANHSPNRPAQSPKAKSSRKPSVPSNCRPGESIFERLAHTGTTASAGRCRPHSSPTKSGVAIGSNSQQNRVTSPEVAAAVSPTKPDSSMGCSQSSPPGEVSDPSSNEKAKEGDDTKPPPKSSSPKQAAPRKSNLKLLCSSRYHPEAGFSELSPCALNLSGILAEYEAGKMSSERVAYRIIEALFSRDFSPGTRWDIDCATVKPVEETDSGEGEAYYAEKEATWDWKDIYSVASAKGTIRFLPEKILVENYSYYVAG